MKTVANGTPYEHDLLWVIRRLVPKSGVVVDAGAHIGNHTIYLALMANACVHAFEPNPVSAAYLRTNIGRNQLADRVSAYPELALESVRGAAPPEPSTGSS